jgi:hypothetical protein
MARLIVFIMAMAVSTSVAWAGAGSCPGDATGDGVVDVDDIVAVVLAFGSTDPDADVTGDGIVDVDDIVAVVLDFGCEASTGPEVTLSGTVTNAWTGDPIIGATVQIGSETLVTDGAGVYSGDFVAGLYTVNFSATNFNGTTEDIILFPDVPLDLDAQLEPVAPVIVSIQVSGDSDPGGTATATAVVEILDGSTLSGFTWMQLAGPTAVLSGDLTDMVSVDLPDSGVFKDELIVRLSEPPITEEQLPPNVPLPEGEFPAGLQNRFQVVGINPFALEEAGLITLEVDVSTTSGNYLADADVHTHLGWKPTSGLRNVPINVPIILHGKDQASYDWSMSKPGASFASLTDPVSQNPEFVPDAAGVYEVTVTDLETMSPVTIEIFAGNWKGVITGIDDDGRPVSDATCVACHQLLGADKFTPWAQTGHAEIFTNNLNSSPYWGPQCFGCHTVGYDLDNDNDGVDESMDYVDFIDSGLIGSPNPNNWADVVSLYPSTAQLANIQCENCHGPQYGLAGVNTLAHGPINPEGAPRVSLSSDVCAQCHGEPLRHARFQQWQLSGHANYEVAIDEGESGNCSRCHTANGFLAWLPILTGDEPGDPLDNITVTWTPDEVHPQTCVTCHDPHNIGTTTGIDTNAIIRISGDTPPLIAGYTAYAVGRGAMCMTCHNSRRGLRNDSTFDNFYLTSEAARAPHGSAQTDVLMGENAYLVTTGIRGAHSFLTDSCVACHMEETPPPADLAYNLGGTNHTFYASDSICTNCHSGLDGPTIQAGVESTLHILQDSVEEGLLALIDEQTSLGNVIDLNGEFQILSVANVQEIVFGESRGRQSMTITFADSSTAGPYRMTDVDVLDGVTEDVLGQFYDFADPLLIKAGWNWGLIHNDGSLGVHNPTYAYTVMQAGIMAIDPPAAAEVDWPEWFDEGELSSGDRR